MIFLSVLVFRAELLYYLSLAEALTLSANNLVGFVSLAREKDYIALARVFERVKYCLAPVGNCNVRTAVRRKVRRYLSDDRARRLVIGIVRGKNTEVRIS